MTAAPGHAERFDSDPDRPLDAINHEVGAIFEHRFTKPSVVAYLCRVHPRFMRGSMTVMAVPDHEPPSLRSLRTRPSGFCARPTRDCTAAAARLRFTLSEPATVIGQIRRIATHRLRPGRWRVTLSATDAVGKVSKPAQTSFTVRPRRG